MSFFDLLVEVVVEGVEGLGCAFEVVGVGANLRGIEKRPRMRKGL